MEYFMYLTNDCNLHCDYCSVLVDCKKNNLPIKMDYSIDKFLAFVEKTQIASGDNELSIYLFGGEPSLEYMMATQIVDAVKNRMKGKYKSNFVLHTNGLLLGEIPSNLAGDLSLVMLSVNYDKIPKYNLAQGYFKTIIENTIHLKSRNNIPIIARLTITETTSAAKRLNLLVRNRLA